MGKRPLEKGHGWSHARLLMIEDDPDQRRLLSELLRRERFEVMPCGTVDEGLEELDRKQFAVAVVDLGLPGKDGIDFAKEIARRRIRTRVIIHTGHGSFESAKEGLNLGVYAYVEKLGNFDHLLDHVHRAATDYLNESLSKAEDEIRFQLRLLDAVEQGVVATNLARKIIYWNRFAEGLLGWRQDEILGKDASIVFNTTVPNETIDRVVERLESGQSWVGELQVVPRASTSSTNGMATSPFPVRLSASPVLDGEGNVAGFIGTFSDITLEKEAEHELRTNANRQAIGAQLGLMALAESDLSVFMQRLTELVTESLQADAGEVLRWEAADRQFALVAGKGWDTERIGKLLEDGAAMSQARTAFETGKTIAVQDFDKDTRYSRSSLQAAAGIASGVSVPIELHKTRFGILGVHSRSARTFSSSEIDFLKMVSNLLASAIQRDELMNRWQSLFNNTLDAVLLCDDNCRYIEVNAAACSMLGYSHDELLLMKLEDLVDSSDHTFVSEQRATMLEFGRASGELWLKRKDGRHVCAEFRSVARVIPGVNLLDLRDITEQKQTADVIQQQQQHLAHVQRVATLGQMAAVLAHEINQPLGAISNFAGGLSLALRKSPMPPKDLADTIEQINEQALRAGDIVRRLRRLNSPAAVEPSLLDVNQIVQETVGLIHGDMAYKQTTIQLELKPDLPQVLGDPVQIQQVLVNLIKNAAEAMESVPREHRWVRIRTYVERDELVIAIRDNGPMLAQEVMDQLFQPYFTTKPEGLGMGLAISKSIVEQHRGEIHATAAPQNGLEVIVRLPVAST